MYVITGNIQLLHAQKLGGGKMFYPHFLTSDGQLLKLKAIGF